MGKVVSMGSFEVCKSTRRVGTRWIDVSNAFSGSREQIRGRKNEVGRETAPAWSTILLQDGDRCMAGRTGHVEFKDSAEYAAPCGEHCSG